MQKNVAAGGAAADRVGPAVLHRAAARAQENFDSTHGGTRGAPKFPSSFPIRFLLRYHRRTGDPEALRILGEKYFKETPAESLAISLDATLPAISADGRFSQAAVQSYLDIFKTVGETVTASSAEGVLWTNEFVR